MRVTRADWAGSVPWAGITGKPTGVETTAELSEKLTKLQADFDSLKASLAVQGRSSAQLNSFNFEWVIGRLEPLQSYSETFNLNGLIAGTPMVVTAQADNLWLNLYASSFENNSFRVIATNVGPYWIDPATTRLTLTFFTNG